MNYPTVSLASATNIPAPPEGASTTFVAFELGAEQVYHIPDEQGRRLIEGWASLRGIDWQDEEILPESFIEGAKEYLLKNPVLLWDHTRSLPIGRVLELAVLDAGLFMRAELFRPGDEDLRNVQPLESASDASFQSFLAKANEVWWGIKNGSIRGLSVRGRTRRRAAWSAELGRFVPQGVQTLIYEISVTSAQVHPASRITGLNTLAKALQMTKALALWRDPMDEKTKKALEAQQVYVEALKSLGDNVELPQDLLVGHVAITKAIQIEEEPAAKPAAPPAPPAMDEAQISKAIADAVAPLQDELNRLKGTPAPIRGRITLQGAPDGAQPKPTDLPIGPSPVEKALSMLANPKNWVNGIPGDNVAGCDAVTAMKLVMVGSKRHRDPRRQISIGDGISIDRAGQALLQRNMQ